MSTLKIKEATKQSAAVLSVNDQTNNYDITLDVWQYPAVVMFEIDGKIVRLSREQVKKLVEFMGRKQ